ncbi:MAG: S-layer homology domain-containing protein, partial [Clostridiales Family XIII bacterium]|nr:S-layer homology domain-containing protein [Clostridiales Family XIII bacterium]
LTRGPTTDPNAEYDARDGSTVVTVYAKTLQALDNGEHTAAAEFMIPDPNGGPAVQHVAAQKFPLELTGNPNPDVPVTEEKPPSGGPSGGPTQTPAQTPQPQQTPASETQITATPAGGAPTENADGSLTLPLGGTATIRGGTEIEAPAGTVVSANGNVRFPEDTGGTLRTPGGVSIALPGGATVESAGIVRIPAGGAGATITYGDGSTAFVPAGYTIEIADPDTPLAAALRIAFDNPFGDVDEDAWYYADMVYVVENGLMNGVSSTSFGPNAPMTRGMLVTVLHRAAGNPAPPADAPAFSDLPADAYYAEAAAWAAASGILTGEGDGRAAPEADITRQDLATVLARHADRAGKTLPSVRPATAFADAAQTAPYARDAIDTLCAAGVLNGRPGDLFDPRGKATRAEVAAVLHRFLEAAE